MKEATCVGIAVSSVFYALCGALGYAAFGIDAPGNLLTDDHAFYEPAAGVRQRLHRRAPRGGLPGVLPAGVRVRGGVVQEEVGRGRLGDEGGGVRALRRHGGGEPV
ncbi:unnamed protein product [Cuscuta campestris]|uniref:Amino acid transporter transmembrane domain-containing protein n=1 Tax=Cuscuta campestris TaxID=132261 RepID=A0A484LPX2_9ASTE|nr:unnamed protein product [Cuscuta campestris]